MAASTVSNDVSDVLFLVLAVVAAGFVIWRRRQQRSRYGLERGERVVRLQQQWLDPIVTVIVVAGVLWEDLATGWLHVVAAMLGAVAGAGAGLYRGRVMFVAARPEEHRVVLRRNVAELAVLAGLLVLKLLARELSQDPLSTLNIVTTGLLAAGLGESVARVGYITWRYRTASSSAAART